MIRIAVIDDGINKGNYDLNVVKNVHKTNKLLNFRKKDADYNSHGTLCAYIINKYFSFVEFISINIYDQKKMTNINRLVNAIYYSIYLKVDIIHLSIGSLLLKDCMSLNKAVNLAYTRNILIISAAEENGIVTYPAYFSNVLAVCHSSYVKKGTISYVNENVSGINIFCSGTEDIIDKYSNKISLKGSSSFATCYITAIVARELFKKLNNKTYSSHNSVEVYKSLFFNKEKFEEKNSLDWITNGILIILYKNKKKKIYKKFIKYRITKVIYVKSDDYIIGIDTALKKIKFNNKNQLIFFSFDELECKASDTHKLSSYKFNDVILLLENFYLETFFMNNVKNRLFCIKFYNNQKIHLFHKLIVTKKDLSYNLININEKIKYHVLKKIIKQFDLIICNKIEFMLYGFKYSSKDSNNNIINFIKIYNCNKPVYLIIK